MISYEPSDRDFPGTYHDPSLHQCRDQLFPRASDAGFGIHELQPRLFIMVVLDNTNTRRIFWQCTLYPSLVVFSYCNFMKVEGNAFSLTALSR